MKSCLSTGLTIQGTVLCNIIHIAGTCPMSLYTRDYRVPIWVRVMMKPWW